MTPIEDKTVNSIRTKYNRGETLKSIAESHDVSVSTVVRYTADLPARRETKGKPRKAA